MNLAAFVTLDYQQYYENSFYQEGFFLYFVELNGIYKNIALNYAKLEVIYDLKTLSFLHFNYYLYKEGKK